jgi:hypothetical protein
MQRFSACLITVLLVGLGGMVTVASAQELLPNGITSVQGSLGGDQKQVVNQYVTRWAGQLLAGRSAQSVSLARQRLVEPMNRPSTTKDFTGYYSPVVAAALGEGIASDNLQVRLNTTTVAAALTDGAGLDIARSGLADETTAVRYWAAKGAAKAMSNAENSIDNDQLARMINALTDALTNEPAGNVREQVYIALAAADTAEARRAVITAMGDQISRYIKNGVSNDLAAEATGLNRIYVRLLYKGGNVDKAEARELVIVTMKYLQLVRNAMEAKELNDSLRAVAMDIVTNGERILNWGVKLYDSGAKAGPALEGPLKAGDTTQFMFNVGEWLGQLTRSAIGISADQLKIK